MKLAGLLMVSLALTFGMANTAAAQTTLTPSTVSDDYAPGNMFDVVAASQLTITSVAAEIGAAGVYKVYGRPDTHVGSTDDSTGWTILADSVNVAAPGVTSFTVYVPLASDDRYAFYIASDDDSGNVSYKTISVGVGDIVVDNPDLAIYAGTGKPALFGSDNRVGTALVGSVTYELPAAPAPVPTLTEWAMILLGLGLAGAAVGMVYRRRVEVA